MRYTTQKIFLMLLFFGVIVSVSGCLKSNSQVPDFSKYATLTFTEENCKKYAKDIGLGMAQQADWNIGCEGFGIIVVSKDNVNNQQGGEKKGTDDGALDYSKKDISSTSTTLPESELPIPWNEMQGHNTKINSEYIEEVAWGSKGDSLLIGVKMNEGKAKRSGAVLRLSQTNNWRTDEKMDIIVNSTSNYVDHDATNKEHGAGVNYYRSNGAIVVEIPNMIPVLEKEFDKNPYALSVDDNKDTAMDFVLIDKKIFEN